LQVLHFVKYITHVKSLDTGSIVTKFIVTGITVYEYKIDPHKQKLGMMIYRKKSIPRRLIRDDSIIISLSKQYIDIFEISNHHYL